MVWERQVGRHPICTALLHHRVCREDLSIVVRFSIYTDLQSHCVQRTVNAKESECKCKCPEHLDKENWLRPEARHMRLFAKEFGRGVRQQRARGKTKENVGTLPLALSNYAEKRPPGNRMGKHKGFNRIQLFTGRETLWPLSMTVNASWSLFSLLSCANCEIFTLTATNLSRKSLISSG